MTLALRPYQQEAIRAIHDAQERGVRRSLVALPTGCHRAGQGILLHDGSVKRVEDVRVGDALMGSDSRPRCVLQLASGWGRMVEVRPVKGEPWVVNDKHILTLVRTNTRNPQPHRNAGRVYPSEQGGALVDVRVDDWQQWTPNRKHLHKLLRCDVDFPSRPAPSIDPYLLGALLGDGGLTQPGRVVFTNEDAEAVAAVRLAAEHHGLRLTRLAHSHNTYSIGGAIGRSANHVMTELRSLGLLPIACEDRFVPDDYKLGSRAVRLKVLAGLIDTDGAANACGGYDFSSKSKRLAADVAFIARSVGLAAYVTEREVRTDFGEGVYQRVSISGDCAMVPCRIPRKQHEPRRQIKDVRRTGVSVQPTGTIEHYYGFTLDGDGRYLLDDFTVTHNTGKTVVFSHLIRERGGTALILAHRDELLGQAEDKLRVVAPELAMSVGRVQAGRDETGSPVVVASVATLAQQRRLERLPREWDTVIVDEAHHAVADSYQRILEHVDAGVVAGFTATPERHDKSRLADVWDEIVYARSLLQMIEAGYLCDLRGLRVELEDLDLSGVKVSRGDYQANDLGRALTEAHAPEHTAAALVEHAADRKTIVFTPTVALAHQTAAAITAAGIPAAAVDGGTPIEERRDILERFHLGELQAVVNCDVLTEGFDEPSVSCIAIAAPTRSRIAYVQKVGRGTRLHPGKSDCLVLDLVGVTDDLKLQSLPALFDLKQPPRKGETVREAVEREQAERQTQEQRQADARRRRARGAELFDRDRLHWLELGDRWVLPAGDESVVLDPIRDDAYRVLLLGENRARILARDLDLGYAQGAAEEAVRQRSAMALADKEAAWRQRPASNGQLGYLRRLGVDERPETQGEASDLINGALVSERLERLDRVLAEREEARNAA